MNEIRPTSAERVDRLIDAVLGTEAPSIPAEPELRPIATLAAALEDALPAIPPGAGFEAQLAARLADAVEGRRTIGVLRHRGRLLVTGAAVSSAAVGVTAFAVWRSTRRQPAHRFWER